MRALIGTHRPGLGFWPAGRGADPLAGYLARGLSATLLLQLTSRGLTFLTILLLSRGLGAAGYGQYAYVMACIGILGALAAVGMPQTVTREVAAFRANHDPSGVNGVIVFALLLGVGASCTLAATYSLLHILFGDASSAAAGVLLAAFLLPLNVLTATFGGIQQGLKRIAAAQFPGAIVGPSVLLLLYLSGCSRFSRCGPPSLSPSWARPLLSRSR